MNSLFKKLGIALISTMLVLGLAVLFFNVSIPYWVFAFVGFPSVVACSVGYFFTYKPPTN